MGVGEEHQWKRLGELLTARRIALGGSNRTRFIEARGVSKQGRIISDIELGKRTNYERGTLTLIEVAYGWVPGSIDRVLRGEDPLEVEAGHIRPIATAGNHDVDNVAVIDADTNRKLSDQPDDVDDDPVLFLLTQEERDRLRRRPKAEQRRVLEGMRASARAVADAILGTGDGK